MDSYRSYRDADDIVHDCVEADTGWNAPLYEWVMVCVGVAVLSPEKNLRAHEASTCLGCIEYGMR